MQEKYGLNSLISEILANREINGHRLIDLVEIQEAVPKDGYIAFKTKLIIPDDVKDTLKGLLHK